VAVLLALPSAPGVAGRGLPSVSSGIDLPGAFEPRRLSSNLSLALTTTDGGNLSFAASGGDLQFTATARNTTSGLPVSGVMLSATASLGSDPVPEGFPITNRNGTFTWDYTTPIVSAPTNIEIVVVSLEMEPVVAATANVTVSIEPYFYTLNFGNSSVVYSSDVTSGEIVALTPSLEWHGEPVSGYRVTVDWQGGSILAQGVHDGDSPLIFFFQIPQVPSAMDVQVSVVVDMLGVEVAAAGFVLFVHPYSGLGEFLTWLVSTGVGVLGLVVAIGGLTAPMLLQGAGYRARLVYRRRPVRTDGARGVQAGAGDSHKDAPEQGEVELQVWNAGRRPIDEGQIVPQGSLRLLHGRDIVVRTHIAPPFGSRAKVERVDLGPKCAASTVRFHCWDAASSLTIGVASLTSNIPEFEFASVVKDGPPVRRVWPIPASLRPISALGQPLAVVVLAAVVLVVLDYVNQASGLDYWVGLLVVLATGLSLGVCTAVASRHLAILPANEGPIPEFG